MKKILMFCMLFVMISTITRSEPVLLRYKYTVGDKLVYVFNASGTGIIKTIIPEDHPEAGNAPIDMPIDLNMEMALETNVINVDSDGTATMEMQIVRYRLSQSGMEVMSFDINAEGGDDENPLNEMFKDKIKMVTTSKGEIKEISGFEALSKMNSQMDISKMMSQIQQQFPDNPVDVGVKWSQELPLAITGDVNSPESKVKTDFEFLGYEEVKGINCAKLKASFSGDFSKLMENTMDGFFTAMGASFEKLDIGYKGMLFFGPEAGLLVAAEISLEQNMTLLIDSPDNDKGPVKMEMNMTLTGVFELE